MSGLSRFELNQRISNFDQHSKKALQQEQRKHEKEKILRQRAAARREVHEAAVAELRRREAEHAEKAELQRQADLEHNKGVSISATLSAAPLSSVVAESKGVKRHADKVVLPASISAELMKQRAFEHGQSFWRISARDGRSTVVSVLEFTAPDGVVMLPPKVVHSLWGLDAHAHGDVRVDYYRLEPGTFVALTPQSPDFQKAVNELEVDLESILSSTLMKHTALSEGDWITVELPAISAASGEAGSSEPADSPQLVQHNLQVCSLKPSQHVSIVDTDLEADITPSAEFMERMAAEQAAARAEAERVAHLEAEAARIQAEAAAAATADAEEKARVAAARRELAARLLPEPTDSCTEPVVHALFQLPDGQRLRRKFLLSSKVSDLFEFVESVGAGGFLPEKYRIVTRYPRRVLECASDVALSETGLGAGQEVFILEDTR